jgi:outer membrane immunogenic protein
VQGGVNWQSGHWVLGFETDIQAESANTSQICVTVCAPGVGVNLSQRLAWFGTARGRVGWANGPLLYYATGGLAYGEVETTLNNANVPLGPGVIANGLNLSSTRVGWTAGGGIEGQVFGNWTAKAEYLYLALGGQSGSFTSDFGLANTQTSTFTTDVREHIFRLGMNYKFF